MTQSHIMLTNYSNFNYLQINNVSKTLKYNLDFETFIAALDVEDEMKGFIKGWLKAQYNNFNKGIILLPESGFKRPLQLALQAFNDNPALSDRPVIAHKPIDMWTWLTDVDNGRLGMWALIPVLDADDGSFVLDTSEWQKLPDIQRKRKAVGGVEESRQEIEDASGMGEETQDNEGD